MTHEEMLPECREREAQTVEILREIREDAKAVRKAVLGNGDTNDSLVARINRHTAYWTLFVILAALVGIAGTVVTIAVAATR